MRCFAAERVGGPAPRGVPYIPVTVQDGVFVAKPRLRFQGRDLDVLSWLRYCGQQGAPNLDPAFTEDQTLRYHRKDSYRALTPWYADRYDAPIRPEDFPDVGFGAVFRWRSEGVPSRDVLMGLLLRLDPATLGAPAPLQGGHRLTAQEWDFVRREVFHEGFVAVATRCTHFCCDAVWKEVEALQRPRDAWDDVFCTCHNARFDPRRAVAYDFLPEAAVAEPTA